MKFFKGVFPVNQLMDRAQLWEPQLRGSLPLSHVDHVGAPCGHDFWVGGMAVDIFFLTSVLEAIPGKIKVTSPLTPSLRRDMKERHEGFQWGRCS